MSSLTAPLWRALNSRRAGAGLASTRPAASKPPVVVPDALRDLPRPRDVARQLIDQP